MLSDDFRPDIKDGGGRGHTLREAQERPRDWTHLHNIMLVMPWTLVQDVLAGGHVRPAGGRFLFR